MTERKRRKKNKVRGERTHGQGDTKNNRGGGCRGGRGRAGANKGKFASIGRLDPKKVRLKPRAKGKSISLENLNQKLDDLVMKGKVTKNKDIYIITSDSGFEKILSQGTINKKLHVQIKASKKAIEKIIKANGIVDGAKEDDDLFQEDEDFDEE
ncbi:MAG: uL15 family ribosomal protein [Candidatus ainarchaeum sp.]|nr:uL15 family ribosomal protein [Candidatus ainarchaeum sp.]